MNQELHTRSPSRRPLRLLFLCTGNSARSPMAETVLNAAVEGGEEAKRAAFHEALLLISRRIDLLLALPIEKLARLAGEVQVRAIGNKP